MARPGPVDINPDIEALGNEADFADEIESDDALEPGGEPVHRSSITGAVADALRTGLLPQKPDESIPGEDSVLRAGDPDIDPLDIEFTGDEAAGGGMSSPDQNNVDDIGEAYGLPEPGGELLLGDDLIAPRDRDRWELNPDSRDKEK